MHALVRMETHGDVRTCKEQNSLARCMYLGFTELVEELCGA